MTMRLSEQMKVTLVVTRQSSDCDHTEYYNIFIPTHNQEVVDAYMSSTDLEVLSKHEIILDMSKEDNNFNQLMINRAVRLAQYFIK